MRSRCAYKAELAHCITNMPPRPMAVVASRALRTPKAKWPAPMVASSSRSDTCTSTFTGIADDSMSSSAAFSGASLRAGGMQTR